MTFHDLVTVWGLALMTVLSVAVLLLIVRMPK